MYAGKFMKMTPTYIEFTNYKGEVRFHFPLNRTFSTNDDDENYTEEFLDFVRITQSDELLDLVALVYPKLDEDRTLLETMSEGKGKNYIHERMITSETIANFVLTMTPRIKRVLLPKMSNKVDVHLSFQEMFPKIGTDLGIDDAVFSQSEKISNLFDKILCMHGDANALQKRGLEKNILISPGKHPNFEKLKSVLDENQNLKRVYLTDCDLTSEQFTLLLSSIAMLPALEYLDVSGNEIPNVEMFVASLRKNNKLTTLDMSNTALEEKHVEHVLQRTPLVQVYVFDGNDLKEATLANVFIRSVVISFRNTNIPVPTVRALIDRSDLLKVIYYP